MIRTTVLTLALATAALTGPARAQEFLRADPNRPTDKIAADLGITEDQFIACFYNVNPDPAHAPGGATQRANKSVLLPCLQKANADITNDRLDQVMDSYRPEGPIHQG